MLKTYESVEKHVDLLENNKFVLKEAKAEFTKLGLIFQFLKYSPKMFEDLAFFARSDLAEIRLHEKRIQFLFVKSAQISILTTCYKWQKAKKLSKITNKRNFRLLQLLQS